MNGTLCSGSGRWASAESKNGLGRIGLDGNQHKVIDEVFGGKAKATCLFSRTYRITVD
jgi:hypothetical protein